MKGKSMGEFTSGDTPLYYEVHGEGKPLILITGFGVSCNNSWQALLPELIKTYQVILFDNRGVGKSGKPDIPYSIPMMGEDTFHLIEHLGLKTPHVFGHSMGSLIAQEMMVTHGDKLGKIILCNTFSHLNGVATQVFKAALDLLEMGVPSEKVLWTLAPWAFSSKFLENTKNIERLGRFYELYKIPLVGFKRQFAAMASYKVENRFKTVRNQVLIIGAESDLLIPHYEGGVIAEKLHDVRYAIIEGGHAAPLEEPLILADLMKDFLS